MIFDPAIMTLNQWRRAITDAFRKPHKPSYQLAPRWVVDAVREAIEQAEKDRAK